MTRGCKHPAMYRQKPVLRALLCTVALLVGAVLVACDYIVVEGRLGGGDCDSLRIAFWSSLGQPVRTTEYHARA